jgi:hypothetical protein
MKSFNTLASYKRYQRKMRWRNFKETIFDVLRSVGGSIMIMVFLFILFLSIWGVVESLSKLLTIY